MAGMHMLKLLVVVVIVMRCSRAAAERNMITHIKGFDGRLPFSLETGYVEVEETHGVELFFYFIESERNPAEDPLILWISGGPGCSGLNPLLLEIGPLRLEMDSWTPVGEGGFFPRLVYFEDSWTKVSNVLFLDAPVGAGFSYAREAPEGLKVSHTQTGRHVWIFLHKWLAQHPELSSNPLYMGGDSFGGKIVPVAALEVADNGGDQLKKNLVGYLVGNPVTEISYDFGGRVPFMHGMGLIADELYQAARGSCRRGDYVNRLSTNARCAEALQAIIEATWDVNQSDILEPMCDRRSSSDTNWDVNQSESCREVRYSLLSHAWANDPEVREMLGVREGSIGHWEHCTTLPHFEQDVPSSIPYHRNLTQRGYRALVYSGDHDMVVPFQATQAWIRTLGYPVVAPWRPWYNSNRQLAGFTTEYANNLTFATVKDAGHTAAEYRTKECFDMFRRWTSSRRL